MNYLACFLIFIVCVYCTISWLIPQLLSWLFKRKYRIKLKVGSIVIHKLILKDVTIVKNGYSIHIEAISLHSSLINSDVTKLLSVVIRDVRVNKDVIDKKPTKSNSGIFKPLLSKQNSLVSNVIPSALSEISDNEINNELNNLNQSVLDFREMELPASIRFFTQFLAVKIYNLSVMVLRAEEHEGTNAGWLCHATAASVRLDGSGTASYLLLSGTIAEASAKLLRKAPDPHRLQTCLAEVSFGLKLEVSMLVDSPLNVEKVSCNVSSPTAILNEGIYKFLQEKQYNMKQYKVPETKRQYNTSEGLFCRIAPIIPKNFNFKIDGSTLTGVRENSRTDFCSSLHSLQINTRFSVAPISNLDDVDHHEDKPYSTRLPQIYLAFQMDQLKINSNKEKLLFLNKLKLDAKLINEVLNLYLILKILTLSYNHNDIYEWFSTYFLPNNLDLISTSPTPQEKKPVTMPRWLEEFCDICVIQGCAEFWNVSLGGRRGQQAATLACKGLKIKLDQLTELRSTPYDSNFARLILGMRHWSTELLIDSAWLQVGLGEMPVKRHHSLGTGFFIKVALVKWGSHGSIGTKVEAMLDCFRIEGSPAIAKILINVIECINDYSVNKSIQHKPKQSKSDSKLTINVNLTNVNLFTLTEDGICLMCRIDTVSIEKNSTKVGFVISGFKIADILPSSGVFICQRTEEMSGTFCFVKLARIDIDTDLYSIQLLEFVEIYWSTNLHLKCLAMIKEMKQFKTELNDTLKIRNENTETTPKSKNYWCLTFKDNVGVHIELSKQHKLLFNFDLITFAREAAGFSVSLNLCHISIDDAQIFTIEEATLERIHDSPKIREERQNAEDFVLKWNNTWGVTILSFRAIFPYQHNFAEAIQDEFVSLTKWIKLVHNYKKKPFTADSPLPSDIYIQVEEFVLEMTDDPFEVKLRDNYELLEDEYKESLKRKTMLDAKVAELCKPHLFLPAGKVEELYAGLTIRNAQIYVQRSRQLARGAGGRPLATCRFIRLRILALADPTLHGTINCIKHLQRLDHDSPWPEEGLEFTTLWCRWITGSCTEWRLQLRDFPQPLLLATSINLWGTLMGAEQSPPPRARRLTIVDQGAPWGNIQIERSMTSLKFYHDLNCEMDQYKYAFGPCWEPIIAQCNLSWDQVVRGSRDPSAALVWWDKMRLLMHGRLTLCVRRLALLLHASLDPYNTTEEMELAWTDLGLDWTNAKIVFKGDFNVNVRTASKYDDCCLLHLPNLRLTIKISWLCLADPNDHHSVIQCAPDKIPEYSINQEHDSFRAFRSQALNIYLSFETKHTYENDCPKLLLYGSTLRWFESLKQILSGATRPTRRGTIFKNVKPKRPQLSRHFRNARLSLALHRFQTTYWMSFAKQRGVDIMGHRVTCGAQHELILTPTRDGLCRRPQATWPPLYINCELNNAEVWFSLYEDKEPTDRLVKYYCLSVGKVSYGREAELTGLPLPVGAVTIGEAPPTHRLVVHDLKGAWTKNNRDIAFALFDTYMKNKQLKKNLSTEALKVFHSEDSDSNKQSVRAPDSATSATPPTTASVQQTSGGQTQALLAQLVAEAEHKPLVFSDDLSEGNTQPPPHAVACTHDDNSHCNWLIALVNAQVVLRGCETKGYVVLCAARAEVRQRLKRSCSTWVGSLQSMQYYATVSARENLHLHENIKWVSVEEIEEKDARAISALPDVPSLVGSGHSAGGVLGSTVGPCEDQALAPQLQRIVSRCTCEFYYVGYEESGVLNEANGGNVWGEPDTTFDSFSLMHLDLDVSTNSLQYAMLLDVVNNLVLYVEPQRKKASESLARMRFKMQLDRFSDPRRPIQDLQNQVRALIARLRSLERETYLIQKTQAEGTAGPNHEIELEELKNEVLLCKEKISKDGEELHAMVACYQESRYRATPATLARPAAPVRVNEICFKHARWRLTDADGQLGIADLVLSNFQYTKNTKNDDSVEHLLELGYVRMTNLLPNEAYTEVLVPTEARSHMPVARQRVLRVFCRERPPVGGISVKEHFEINVEPITIGLTKKFFNKMLKFCFPERDPEKIEESNMDYDDTASTTGSLKQDKASSKKAKSKKLGKDTNFYVPIEQKDDVEKMKERAEKNKLFIYIKIPNVPVRINYKGNKEKNFADLRDISITIPTLEYHNVTWTWLDFLLAMKSDSKKVILSQAIRQKLQFNRNKDGSGGSASPPEEDKARMLLGDRRVGESKPQKKGVPGAFRLTK